MKGTIDSVKSPSPPVCFTHHTWDEFSAMFKAYAYMQRIPTDVIALFHNLEQVNK